MKKINSQRVNKAKLAMLVPYYLFFWAVDSAACFMCGILYFFYSAVLRKIFGVYNENIVTLWIGEHVGGLQAI